MSLNPFDLRGPEFLFFFFCWSCLVAVVLTLLRRQREMEDPQAGNLPQDPYEIAYLRGGRNHLLQTALVALVDRGLLKVKGLKLKTADPDAVNKAQRPLDKAILTKFLWEAEASELYDNEAIGAQAEAVGTKLRATRLLPDRDQESARTWLFVGALALLWLVAGVKIAVAVSRGRYNIIYLIVLAVVFAFVLYRLANPFRTSAGQKVMKRIHELLNGLYSRRSQLAVNHATNEMTLLAAAFGLAALPPLMANNLKPLKLHKTSGSGCGSGCAGGSSCGGGSGCGGGGCGGGCGGCGG